MALTLPDEHQLDALRGRALRGKDLLFLRQWTGLSIADCCYLLGMPVMRWHYYQRRPDQLIEDAGVALLARALLTHPEAHYLPAFPTVAEVYPAYQRALQQSATPLPEPDTALGLLVGRDRASVRRWRTGTSQRQIPGPVRHLLLVLQTLLRHHGVPGFEALVERAAFEAAARGLDLHSPAMKTWTRRKPYRPRAPNAPRRGRPPKSGPPADATSQGQGLDPPSPATETAPSRRGRPRKRPPARPPSPDSSL
ncbi:MAG: hypothetical protein KDJ28_07255 [Candidatus Competibacteraceae bacterium]|nr:hypothetical protein [Candidatus Competibacteraceae bacterium]